MKYDQLSRVIRQVTSLQFDSELTHYLQDIQNRLEDQIIRYFFKLLKDLPAQFLLPHIPLSTSIEFKDKTGQSIYKDVIHELNWSVGEKKI